MLSVLVHFLRVLHKQAFTKNKLYTSCIVVKDWSGWLHDLLDHVNSVEDIGEMNELFNAFVRCVNFRFGGASRCDRLTLGNPVDGASKPYEETGHGARLK